MTSVAGMVDPRAQYMNGALDSSQKNKVYAVFFINIFWYDERVLASQRCPMIEREINNDIYGVGEVWMRCG